MGKASDRLIELDVLKGILIVAVIIGHTNLEYSRNMYWFHMPAFFMTSGILFSKSKTKVQVKSNSIKKFKSLIIPYFTFIVITIFVSSFLDIIQIDFKYILKLIYGGKLMVGVFGVYWFITTLLFTYIIYSIISYSIKNEWLLLCVIAFIFLVARLEYILIYTKKVEIIVPFNVDSSFMAIVFFYFGDKLKKHYSLIKDFVSNNSLPFFIIITLVVSSIFLSDFVFQFDLKYQYYGNWFLSIAIPMFFSSCLLLLSILLSKNLLLRIGISKIGRASLLIMYLHLLIKEILLIFGLESLINYLLLSLVIPLVFYDLINRSQTLSFFFLGKWPQMIVVHEKR